MTVLRGEGTTVILYGMISVPAGPRTGTAYLARPDREGEWPTVLVAPPGGRISSAVKELCRKMARHGFVALASMGSELEPYLGFVSNASSDWSNAEHGAGLLAVDDAGGDGVRLAAASDRVAAFAMISTRLDADAIERLGEVSVPILGLLSRDESDFVPAARERAPHAEWVIYDVDPTFWDIGRPGYEDEAADDALARARTFFAAALPPRS